MGWYYDTIYCDFTIPHACLDKGEEFQTTDLVGCVTPEDTMQLHDYRITTVGLLVLEKISVGLSDHVLSNPVLVKYTGSLHLMTLIFKLDKRTGGSLEDLEEVVYMRATFVEGKLTELHRCGKDVCDIEHGDGYPVKRQWSYEELT